MSTEAKHWLGPGVVRYLAQAEAARKIWGQLVLFGLRRRVNAL